MIGYLLHKRKLTKLKREKELQQVNCNHTYSYLGEFVEYFNGGCEVYSEDFYRIKCTQCGHVKSFERKNEAFSYINFNKQ